MDKMIFGKKNSDDVDAPDARLADLERQNEIMRSVPEFHLEPGSWTEGHRYRDADDATMPGGQDPFDQYNSRGCTCHFALYFYRH